MSVPDSKATILVVDDESSILRLVAERLQAAVYTVLEASSGPEALDVIAGNRHRIDLVLTDLIMPGMTGRARADAVSVRCAGVPVIFMSGYIDGQRSEALGQDIPFIQKPLDWKKLEEIIQKTLTTKE